MSLISLQGVTLIMAGNRLLDAVNWQIQPRERIGLVGRNGAGKSTLLKLLQGEIKQDAGQINCLGGLRVAGLVQEVPDVGQTPVYDFLVQDLNEVGKALLAFKKYSDGHDLDGLMRCQEQMDALKAWDVLARVEMLAHRLGVNPEDRMQDLSGGMRRRVLLAAVLIAEPDLLLLDEPTNHLDMQTIEWLESYLKGYNGSVLLVTHDRAFLDKVANRILEIDRGQLHTYICDYETYLDRREARRLAEDKHNALFDKRLQDEEAWIRQGVKARRTRNEGRVRALKAMRVAHAQRLEQLGTVKTMAMDSKRSGTLVIEASDLNFSYGSKLLLNNFSLNVTRGDKIGIIGINGCGKTTLVRLLLGELTPDSGTVRLGTGLQVAYLDQLRDKLDDNQTVMANVAEGADHVTINGKQKHVASYLRDFLFAPERFNQRVSTLSGGERNRLLLAKLLAKPVNLLVMDEPTNDLDIETLELLENLLLEYTGTLLLISHDRAFINQVVTSVLVHEGEGVFNEYQGGYDNYCEHKKESTRRAATTPLASSPPRTAKLTFNEQRELKQLPQQIEKLESDLAILHEKMSDPVLYEADPGQIGVLSVQASNVQTQLTQLYARWEALEDK